MYLIFNLGQINYYKKGSLGCIGIEAVAPSPSSAMLCSSAEHILHLSCLMQLYLFTFKGSPLIEGKFWAISLNYFKTTYSCNI